MTKTAIAAPEAKLVMNIMSGKLSVKRAAAPKSEGKCSKLHAMWAAAAGDGELLPRAFAIELAVAEGVNASTARTQYQVWFKRAQLAALVEPTTD